MAKLSLNDRLKGITGLSREAQLTLRNDMLQLDPSLLKPWYWRHSCVINVLLVTDRSINFGPGGFALSTFVSVFRKMQTESPLNLRYRVTLAHRDDIPLDSAGMLGGDSFIHNRIKNFDFSNPAHFQPNGFDQVWLFGFHASAARNITQAEIDQIEAYMNGGGGLFATGDHGPLGKSLCGQIPRVKDMRIWDNTSINQDLNEVSMRQRRRNDTNQPKPGELISSAFSDERDNIPQPIYPKLYGIAPGPFLPHSLLSIHPSLKANGIIDIMPDHPHEGQCKPETTFTVTNPRTGVDQDISTQNISIALVRPGNVSGTKAPADAQCFPSIGVFDGRPANVGRIVVDATWHHFLNLNIEGLDPGDFRVVEQYFRNISHWISRRKIMFCLFDRFVLEAMHTDLVIEASLGNPSLDLKDIPTADLFTLGHHVMDIVAQHLNPVEGHLFALNMVEPLMPKLIQQINPWETENSQKDIDISDQWINSDPLCAIAIGTAMIRLRDQYDNLTEPIEEDQEEEIRKTFQQGLVDGLETAIEGLEKRVVDFSDLKKQIVRETYVVEGTITTAAGKPAAGYRVRAVDMDFTAENRLGVDAITDANGSYRIPYKQTDFVINGKESGGADIVLYLYNPQGELVHKTEIAGNSPEKTTIDVKLP